MEGKYLLAVNVVHVTGQNIISRLILFLLCLLALQEIKNQPEDLTCDMYA